MQTATKSGGSVSLGDRAIPHYILFTNPYLCDSHFLLPIHHSITVLPPLLPLSPKTCSYCLPHSASQPYLLVKFIPVRLLLLLTG